MSEHYNEKQKQTDADPFEGYEQVISALGFALHFILLFISIVAFPVYLAVGLPMYATPSPWYFITMRCIALGINAVYLMISLFWSGFLAPAASINHFIPLYLAFALELIAASAECFSGALHPLISVLEILFRAALTLGLCFIGAQNDLEDSAWCKLKVYCYKKTSLLPPKMTVEQARRAFKMRVGDMYGIKIYVYQEGFFRLFSDEFGLLQN